MCKGTLRAVRALLPAALLLCGVGCEERNQLAAELAAVKQEATQLQPKYSEAQTELVRVNKMLQTLKADPAVRRSGSEKLEAQVAVLAQQKEQLEAEIAELRKEYAAYREANP